MAMCSDCGFVFNGWIPTTCPRCNQREAEKLAVATALAHAEGRIRALRDAHEANACDGPWVDGAQTEIARRALLADDAAAKERR